MPIKILVGNCRDTLKTLEPESVQCCITSPPYYALRRYPGEPSLWADGWVGQLGLEPTVEMYVRHLVECLHEVKRVLRKDGTLWLNIGDSYSGSHGNGYKQTLHKVNHTTGEQENVDLARQINRQDDGKPKDLLEVPSDVVRALKQDGWYLRSRIPWIKRNSMPESVDDRPTSSVEYVFLLSKSQDYFYDRDAVRVPLSPNGTREYVRTQNGGGSDESMAGHDASRAGLGIMKSNPNGRNRRNTDWFIESWQGLLQNDEGDPLALVVNPSGFREAHYATFATKFVEPMLKASLSEVGCCPECGSPWERVVEKEYKYHEKWYGEKFTEAGRHSRGTAGAGYNEPVGVKTVGWQPSCKHGGEPVPCTVIDCFGGAGTVGLVADRHGYNAILCELADDYSAMSSSRLVGDAPMFAEVEVVKDEPAEEFPVQLSF